MRRVGIYGVGKVAEYFYKNHAFKDEKLVFFVLSNSDKKEYMGYPVVSINKIDTSIDILYMANSYIDTIYAALNMGISKHQLVICNKILKNEYVSKNMGILDLSYDEYISESYEQQINWENRKPEYVIMRAMNNPINMFKCDNILNVFGKSFVLVDDFCRYGTLRLIIEEIINRKIEGDIAELGVYRGEFAKYLNQMFPDRKLYLFDTFSGFSLDEVKTDLDKGFTSEDWFEGWEYFKETSVELVMSKMRYPNQCVVKKGIFPSTIPADEIKYAFVSLDCDLYEPIFAGLKYFYPRISKGGYIMIHDYNQVGYLKGVKQAVEDFEKEIGETLPKVPITDICGTLVVCK